MIRIFELARVARIGVDFIGSDFESYITNLEQKALEKDTQIFQVWLPPSSPSTPLATGVLREHGYFLGEILPCRANGDCLLMQKVTEDPKWEDMVLHSERAKKIGEIVREDWKRVVKS